MRSALLLWAALATASSASAQRVDLTPAERAKGWIRLFDGDSTFGWTINGDGNIADHRLRLPSRSEATRNSLLPPRGELVIEGRDLGVVLSARVDDKRTNPARWGGGATTRVKLDDVAFNGQLTRLTLEGGRDTEIGMAKLLPTDMKPLFNGDTLDGWTVFPGKKSKFEAKDGEIQLTDGPGDLQTTAKYRNFILQLECKSNGKHLNSGVFFRCRAGEYQNGYECQIQNGFGKEKEYTIETFDPMSHKLLEKKKVMSGAIDWGTGSIYRRVPARSEVAKDHEWFTLTVLAVDNHFATWVDGIQEVDWTDNRPPSDNARNGYRSEAGHISLQGHDPTTNLSFRNLRIQELP